MMSIREIKRSFETTNCDLYTLLISNTNRSLVDLRKIISNYLNELTEDLSDVVSSDIDSYIEIVNNILNFKGYFKFLDSLIHLENAVSIYKNHLEEISDNFSKYLKRKQELVNEKNAIYYSKRALDCAFTITKLIEKAQSKQIDTNLEFFIRCFDSYCSMNVFLTYSRNENLVNYLKNQTDNLITMFDNYFQNLNFETNLDEIIYCLYLYKQLKHESKCEQLIRKYFIQPELKIIFSSKDLDCDTSFRIILNDILRFLRKISSFIEIVSCDQIKNFNTEPYNVLLNSIWLEIDEKLVINLRSLYSPADTIIFKKNYEIFNQFYDTFELYFRSERQLNEFRSHESYRQKNCYNFEIYFQIISQETYLLFESRLSTSFLVINNIQNCTDENDEYYLKPTSIFSSYLNRCFSDDHLILKIFSKFWKLALKLIAAYVLWIQLILPKIQEFNFSNDNDRFFVINLYVSLLHDIDLVQGNLEKFFEKIHSKTINKLSSKIRSICMNSLNEPIDLIIAYKTKLKSILIDFISKELINISKPITELPRFYRKTNKDFTNDPSDYVKKLNDFFFILQKAINCRVPSYLVIEIFNEILFNYYADLSKFISEIINSVHKTENSIRRLKKSKNKENVHNIQNGISSKQDGITDEIKIFMQLKLDICTIHTHIKNYFPERSSKIDKHFDSLLNELKK